MIQIIYSCDDKYFDCLYLSILSIIHRCNEQIEFVVLSGNFKNKKNIFSILTNNHISILNKLVKKYNEKNKFKCIDMTFIASRELTNTKNFYNKHFSPYASLRLLIDLLPDIKEKCIYLDTDIMACGNINELFKINVDNIELCAAHNWWLRHTIAHKSFNSGVLLLNIREIKETRLLVKSRKFYNDNNLLWSDQTALNKSISKFAFFPGDSYRYNRQSKLIKDGDILKHFCNRPWGWPFWNNIKQNDIVNVHKHLKIYCFDEDYKIWINEKKKWK